MLDTGVFDTINTTLLFWEVLTFLVLLAVVALGLWAVRLGWRYQRTGAREELDRRYARGELTREEYLTIKDDTTRGPDA